MSVDPLLSIDSLSVTFTTERGVVRAVDEVSIRVARGETVALVGESGSGKSATVMSILGLTRAPNVEVTGSITFDGQELLSATETELDRVRGSRVCMVFQDPMTALNPVQRVRAQIVEQIQAHERVSTRAAQQRATELLVRVGIPHAEHRVRDYPHQFSGGMRQRVMIAMALSTAPELLVADEPTTALDVTVQAQILGSLRALCDEQGTSLLLVTHDLGVVAEIADRVTVLYSGRVVEEGSVRDIFYDPHHPYAWGLLGSVARLDVPRRRRLSAIPGTPPSPTSARVGCGLRPRCPHAHAQCSEEPELRASDSASAQHRDRCWLTLGQKSTLRGPAGDIRLVPEEATDNTHV
jgi:oligopeptide/dipeptide ABC transporter ATP-binding protein